MQAQKKTCAPEFQFQNVKRQKKQLKELQERAERVIQRQQKKLNRLKRTLKQVEEEARKTEDYCESTIVSVIDSLQKHFMSVKKFIGVQEEEAAKKVQLSLKSLQDKKKRMKKRRDELKRLAQMDNDVSFSQEWSALHQLCENDLHHALHDILEEPHTQFEFTKRAVDEFGRQLKKLCDRDVTLFAQSDDMEEQQESEGHSQGETGDDVQQRCEAISSESPGLFTCQAATKSQNKNQPKNTLLLGLPGLHSFLNVEPTTRDEFLQYACSLTFNPATAHEDLVISTGDREVRLSPLRCNGPAVRCPQRFIHRKQLLCRQSLQAARCYYEVEVEGDKAEIALTYKGIDRKSLNKLSAFGGNDKSWSLDRSNYYSVSHRGVSEQLRTPPAHQIIGVYLQFREGLLSFYEVSDTMTLLYKWEARFTEPLYPGFWLGEKCCIRICDLQ